MRDGWWPSVVRLIGGVHDLGKLTVLIIDSGLIIAWDGVVRWERRTAYWQRVSRKAAVEQAARARL